MKFILFSLLLSTQLFAVDSDRSWHENKKDNSVEFYSLRSFLKNLFKSKKEIELPLNSMDITYRNIIDKIKDNYLSDIESHSTTFEIKYIKDDDIENAKIVLDYTNVVLSVYSGLLKNKFMTRDAFAAIICHEVGHWLGGAPKINQASATWASVEGEADYWASSKCLKKIFEKDDNAFELKKKQVPLIVKQRCKTVFVNNDDDLLCQRVAMSGFEFVKFIKDASGRGYNLSFKRKDITVVTKTNLYDHPLLQCRLDTFFRGSLCSIDYTLKVSDDDPNYNTCTRKNGHAIGARPRCWYYPSTD